MNSVKAPTGFYPRWTIPEEYTAMSLVSDDEVSGGPAAGEDQYGCYANKSVYLSAAKEGDVQLIERWLQVIMEVSQKDRTYINEVVDFFVTAKREGSPSADFFLGLFRLYESFGLGKNYYKAFDYFQRANQAEIKVTPHFLVQFGQRLMDENEDFKAFECFFEAANKRHADAYYHVGLMYLHGYGIAQSDENAQRYLGLAWKLGVVQALKYLE